MLDRSAASCRRACRRRISSHEHRKSRIRSRASGFTFAEVVIATALLIIAIVPMLRALTSGQVTGSIVEHRSVSLILAQGKLDEIRARSVYHYDDSFAEAHSSVGGSYLCKVIDSAVTANIRDIKVSVGYDLNDNSALDAGEIEVTLATLVARRW
jgi:Tfp pilus assembly protein PilV